MLSRIDCFAVKPIPDAARSKSVLLAELRDARRRWEQIVAQVADDMWSKPGAMGDWNLKDVMAHLNGWRVWTVARLEAAAAKRNDPTPPWPAALMRPISCKMC